MGRGVTLSANAVFGGTTNVSFRGNHPWISGDHLSVEALAYHSERDNTLLDFREKSDRIEVTFGYHIGRYGRMSGTLGYWGMASDLDGTTLDSGNHDQYFLGGANSVRGYDLEILGREIQGKNRLLGTVEYRYLAMPVRPFHIMRWSIAVGLEVATFARTPA